MAKQQTTAETPVSKTKEQIIKEAQRIEESLLYTSKGHFAASHFWSKFHLWIGIPMVVLSAIMSAAAFSKLDDRHIVSGFISLAVVAMSSVMTFLNPNDKLRAHLTAGNQADTLMNNVRVFWSIDCWQETSEQLLTSRLKKFSEDKGKINSASPQIPKWAYKSAKKGIDKGEASYEIDKSSQQ